MRRRRRAHTLEPRRRPIHTHRLVIVALAALEHTRVVVRRHVPIAAHLVVDVLAVARRVRARACAEAELGIRDEGCPFVILFVRAEGVPKDKSTDWVAVPVCTVRVELN